jgi:hypothetical protein
MKNLSKKEVLAELKKLGINSTSELNSDYKKYKKYSAKSSQTFLSKYYENLIQKLDILK